jgi:hypothetical protein
MAFQYPTDQLDNLEVYKGFVGSYWTDLLYGNANLVDLLRAYRLAERQLFQQSQELQDTVGRNTCPVFHIQNWYKLVVYQSQEVPGHPLLYGSGAVFGPQPVTGVVYKFGVGTDQAVAYPVSSQLQDCSYVASDIVAPAVTWSRGADFTLSTATSNILFTSSLFSNPGLTPTPVLDSSGNVIDQSITLWLFKAKLDWQYLYQQFGYVIGVGQGLTSSKRYKDMINAVSDAVTSATSYDAVARIVEAISGIPRVKATGETVQVITQDNAHTLIITDQQVYRFVLGVTPIVTVGQVMNQDDQLIDAIQIVEPTNGNVPAFIYQLSLGKGFVLADIPNELIFSNTTVPLGIQMNVSGYTRLTWPLGGFAQDVTTFFNDLHSRGVAAGATLANFLDTRFPTGALANYDRANLPYSSYASSFGILTQPDQTVLPSTINPLKFLFQNVLRANCLIVFMRTSQFGQDALGTGLSFVLRKILPPHTSVIIFASVSLPDDGAVMVGDGTSTSTGYVESYSLYSTPG